MRQPRVTTFVPKRQCRFCSRQMEADRALFRFHRLWFKTPELKAMSVDRFFDRMAGKIVRRSVLGSDRTDLSPGAKLTGQLASGRISRERAQTGVCI
jgi:hypothetical protein